MGLVVAHDLLLYGGRVVSEWRHLNHALQDGEDVYVSTQFYSHIDKRGSALVFDTVKKHFKTTKTNHCSDQQAAFKTTEEDEEEL